MELVDIDIGAALFAELERQGLRPSPEPEPPEVDTIRGRDFERGAWYRPADPDTTATRSLTQYLGVHGHYVTVYTRERGHAQPTRAEWCRWAGDRAPAPEGLDHGLPSAAS